MTASSPLPSQTDAALTPEVSADHDKILIVDFGSQVTQLIARRVREEGVYSEIVPFNKAEAAFDLMKPKAVILSGGPASVLDDNAPAAPMAILTAGVPVLGICYGEHGPWRIATGRQGRRPAITASSAAPTIDHRQGLAALLGGPVAPSATVTPVWMSHGDKRHRHCPPGFERCRNLRTIRPISVIADETRRQIVRRSSSIPRSCTPRDGGQMIRNFVLDRSLASPPNWNMHAFRAARRSRRIQRTRSARAR